MGKLHASGAEQALVFGKAHMPDSEFGRHRLGKNLEIVPALSSALATGLRAMNVNNAH